MRCNRKITLALILLATRLVPMYGQNPPTSWPIDTPALSGTVPTVQTINTGTLLQQMSTGGNNLVLVAAHRGYWINAPENSEPALQAAFNSGVEAIEIDLRTTFDKNLVVSHDADLLKETNGTGFINQTSLSQIQSMQLRDRKGNVQFTLTMLTFAQALTILQQYQTTSGSQLNGPVLIVDLKDGFNTAAAWSEYLSALQVAVQVYQQSPIGLSGLPAVVFKMKMRDISVDPTIGIGAAYTAHPAYGHIIATVNPEDATNTAPVDWRPSSTNFATLVGLSTASTNYFLQQFELNIRVFIIAVETSTSGFSKERSAQWALFVIH
jgi:hypothetical protein